MGRGAKLNVYDDKGNSALSWALLEFSKGMKAIKTSADADEREMIHVNRYLKIIDMCLSMDKVSEVIDHEDHTDYDLNTPRKLLNSILSSLDENSYFYKHLNKETLGSIGTKFNRLAYTGKNNVKQTHQSGRELETQYQTLISKHLTWTSNYPPSLQKQITGFLDRGVDINLQEDEHGATALSLAASIAHSSLFKVLVERGAKLNIYDNNGNSALSWALLKFSETWKAMNHIDRNQLDQRDISYIHRYLVIIDMCLSMDNVTEVIDHKDRTGYNLDTPRKLLKSILNSLDENNVFCGHLDKKTLDSIKTKFNKLPSIRRKNERSHYNTSVPTFTTAPQKRGANSNEGRSSRCIVS